MLDLYKKYGFHFVLCDADKTIADMPDSAIESIAEWPEQFKLSQDAAQEYINIGQTIGAVIPEEIVIIDLNRRKQNGIDGVKEFRDIKERYNCNIDFLASTFCVMTPQDGLHIHFRTRTLEDFDPGIISDGINILKKGKYSIAAGSPGYKSIGNSNIIPLPEELRKWLFECEVQEFERKKFKKNKPLNIRTFQHIFRSCKINNFRTKNEIISFAAHGYVLAGSDEKAEKIIDAWLFGHAEYSEIYEKIFKKAKNLEAKTIDEIIKTFTNFLKAHNVNQNTINNVKKLKEISQILVESEQKELMLPFPDPDYSWLVETQEAMEFFNSCGKTSAASILENALKNLVICVDSERRANYYFDGSRWERLHDMYLTIYTILFRCAKIIFAYHQDQNAKFIYLVAKLNDTVWKRHVIDEFNSRKSILKEYVPWDGTTLRESLTTDDGVIDFSDKKLNERKGLLEEYRLTHVGYMSRDIINAKAPEKFMEFLYDIMPDSDTLDTIIYAMSMFVSGNASKKLFQIWIGERYNGKTTLIEIIKNVMGDKAVTYNSDMLMYHKFKDNSGNNPELAKFQGAYVAFGSETSKKRRLAVEEVKRITGGDTIQAAAKYKNPVEFKATWQLVLASNDMPSFDAQDDAFLERLLVIPFIVTFVKDKKQINEFLRKGYKKENIKIAKEQTGIIEEISKERPAIINFLINKYVELQTKLGGIIPQSEQCLREKGAYVEENDDIGPFVRDMCDIAEEMGYSEPSSDLTDAFNKYTGKEFKSVTKMLKKFDKRLIGDEMLIQGRRLRVLLNIRLKDSSEELF